MSSMMCFDTAVVPAKNFRSITLATKLSELVVVDKIRMRIDFTYR